MVDWPADPSTVRCKKKKKRPLKFQGPYKYITNEFDNSFLVIFFWKIYLSAGSRSKRISLMFGWMCFTRCGVINVGTFACGSFCWIFRQCLWSQKSIGSPCPAHKERRSLNTALDCHQDKHVLVIWFFFYFVRMALINRHSDRWNFICNFFSRIWRKFS